MNDIVGRCFWVMVRSAVNETGLLETMGKWFSGDNYGVGVFWALWSSSGEFFFNERIDLQCADRVLFREAHKISVSLDTEL
jgi:hypothetical protein